MLAYWPYILLALLLLVLGTAVILYFVLRRARMRAAPKTAALAPAPVVAVEDPSTAGLYSPLAALGLKASFARAMRTLRAHVTRRDYRYRLPWFLMVGESGSGKSTALGESGLGLPLGRPAEQTHGVKQGLSWFFFDRGVVLDVAGDMVLRRDGEASNQRGWNQLARLLQKHRPERPLDGVVLTIPATDLLAARGLDGRARVEQKAACLYRKLWQAQKLLGMSFPVYVLVTKCDEVTGFQSLCRELPASAREEMFGWSSPYTLETAYRPEWVEEAFQNVHRYLFQLQVEVFAERADVRDRDGLFLLPTEMQALKGPLQLYLDHVFKESSFHDSFFFRGLYFCGDAGEDAQATIANPLLAAPPSADALTSDDWLEASPDPFAPRPEPSLQPQGPRRLAFVKDVFEKKIFVEDMLARPLRRTALSRNRTVFAAQVLALAIPILGLVGLLFTYGGLQRRSDELYDLLVRERRDLQEIQRLRVMRARDRLEGEYDYRQSSYVVPDASRGARATTDASAGGMSVEGARVVPAAYFQTRAGEAAPPSSLGDARDAETDEAQSVASDETHDNEQHLFAAMAKVNAKNYYSVFIPSSWFSPLDSETRDSLVNGFQYVILEDLAIGLRRRTKEFLEAEPIPDTYERGSYDGNAGTRPYSMTSAVTSPTAADSPTASDAGGAPPVYDQAFRVGADATLRGYIEGFAELRLNRERYRNLAEQGGGSLEELKALVIYLGHDWPREDFDPNNSLYVSALRKAHGAPLKPDSKEVMREFGAKVSQLVEAMYERSFERRTGGVRYDYLGDISQTEALLSRPEYTWLATYTFEPRSPFHDMTLSSGLGELRKALEGLSRESFMGATPGGAGLQRQLFLRRQLVWDSDTLRQALALCADYERFAGERGAYSKNLDDTVRESALTRLRANVAALVARSQRYEPAAQTPGEPARRASLAAEVHGLEQAQEPLSQLLDATSRLQIDVGLRPALSNQSAYLLGAINREFQSGQFYSMAHADFSWWDGQGPVSLPAFDADNPDALAAYLASERKRISYLARDLALPVFTFMTAHGIPAEQIRADSRVDWDEILTELDRYDNKQPGGSIATLEEFIRVQMDRTSPEDCNALASADGVSLDFFIRTRNNLRRLLRRRCVALAQNRADSDYLHDEEDNLRALDNYRDIAAEFNRTLAGRFPFADAPGGVPLTEAEPDDVLNFFALFDKKKAAAREALARNRQLGSVGDEAAQFLDRMEAVRGFFAQYLEKKQGPFVDFQLQFRSNREMETAGARQIIDWTLDVGRRKYGYRDQEMSGRWVLGEPVRLTLRWANNSPVVPSVSPDTATLRARERVATFDFKSRWSLLAMMEHQATVAGDFQYGVDTLPYTLKFVVPTRPDGDLSDRQPEELRGADAQVFMSLSLVKPGSKEPLVLPAFPAWAPKF